MEKAGISEEYIKSEPTHYASDHLERMQKRPTRDPNEDLHQSRSTMGTAAGGTASKVSHNQSTLKKSRHQLSPIIHTEKRPRNQPTHSTLASKKASIKQTPQQDIPIFPYTEKKKYTKMENYD